MQALGLARFSLASFCHVRKPFLTQVALPEGVDEKMIMSTANGSAKTIFITPL